MKLPKPPGQRPDMRIVNHSELLGACGEALGVPSPVDVASLLKPTLRRAVFQLTPCSAADLIRFVADPLAIFGDLREEIEQALNEMIAYGDIFEMRRLESDPWDAPAYLLRPAPPSFVLRSNGDAIIIGVSGDVPSALPAELAAQVKTEGPVRVLRSNIGDLSEHLKRLGLTQLSEQSWLRTPPLSSAQNYMSFWIERLAKQSSSPALVEGLEILDTARQASYYKGRWCQVEDRQAGLFVARRSQKYGAKLWSFIELQQGAAVRVLDLHAEDDWQRPCDIAWRLQAAIDAASGAAQKVTLRNAEGGACLEFQSPLPAFAERRLALVGSKAKVQGALFGFRLSESRVSDELTALQTTLWLEPTHVGGRQ